jgi:hypothetical protein
MKRLVEKARVIPYTKTDLKLLAEIVTGYWYENKIDFRLYDAITDCIRDNGFWIDRPIENWPDETWSDYKYLNILQYLLVYRRKIFMFLTCVDNKRVPIYIEQSSLKPFVEWRLRIGK